MKEIKSSQANVKNAITEMQSQVEAFKTRKVMDHRDRRREVSHLLNNNFHIIGDSEDEREKAGLAQPIRNDKYPPICFNVDGTGRYYAE